MLTGNERAVLKEMQSRFPFAPRPWKVIARRLGMTEEAVMKHARDLKERGLIRYVGVIVNSRPSEVASTLVAMRVPRSRISGVAATINAYPHVSHNYLRSGRLNMWFTLSARSGGEISRILRDMRRRTGIDTMLDLRTRSRYKINAVFDL